MSEHAPLLEARAVSKSYNIGARTLPVLQNVDLTVGKGEILGIMGSSGAGKSTLLHLLGLLDTPSQGEILIGGKACASLPPAARAQVRNRRIGFVFQFYHLIPELSALENTLLQRMVGAGISEWMGIRAEQREKAKTLLTQFGLGNRLDHRPSQLSGGERQRVAIARALLPNPEMLLCDEPTGNLDSKTGVEILDILEGIHKSMGATFVIVTHDERIARRCHRVIRMVDGRIVQEK